jgi:type II secretory pathway pseudopilin PulG
MSTGAIIAIVVVVLILLAVVAFVLPRMRRKAEVRARERELGQRREQVAEHHRTEASTREREAEMAERRANLAQAEAEKQRAQAQMEQQRADMHERGMADDELVADHERDHFAPAMGNGETVRNDETVTDTDTGAERAGRFDRESAAEDAPAEPRRL